MNLTTRWPIEMYPRINRNPSAAKPVLAMAGSRLHGIRCIILIRAPLSYPVDGPPRLQRTAFPHFAHDRVAGVADDSTRRPRRDRKTYGTMRRSSRIPPRAHTRSSMSMTTMRDMNQRDQRHAEARPTPDELHGTFQSADLGEPSSSSRPRPSQGRRGVPRRTRGSRSRHPAFGEQVRSQGADPFYVAR